MDDSSLEFAFLAVLGVCLASGLGVRRAAARRPLVLLGFAPLVAFVAYEAGVARVMPGANIRLDWMLLFPILIAHGIHVAARWRRLGAAAVD